MRDARVVLRDGREFIGPVWAFNIIGGYLTIPSVTNELLYFREMISAVEGEARVDLLERARKWGWDGMS